MSDLHNLYYNFFKKPTKLPLNVPELNKKYHELKKIVVKAKKIEEVEKVEAEKKVKPSRRPSADESVKLHKDYKLSVGTVKKRRAESVTDVYVTASQYKIEPTKKSIKIENFLKKVRRVRASVAERLSVIK